MEEERVKRKLSAILSADVTSQSGANSNGEDSTVITDIFWPVVVIKALCDSSATTCTSGVSYALIMN